ncbi:hypothetical protein B0H13DRAFT_1853590 [Mycena leptocephala]|nr:hypothetical protein B0H13DRAFT_1853590 [Mycena leptocephala]
MEDYRFFSESGRLMDREQQTPSPPAKKQTINSSPVTASPEASNIRKALSMQVPPKPKALKPLSISNPHIFSDLTKIAPRHEVLYYNTRTEPAFGGSRSAFPGMLGGPIFDSDATTVCLKQGFHVRGDDDAKVMYEGISQIAFLGEELNLLGWGA